MLEYFRPGEPWRPSPSMEGITNKKPNEFSAEDLEDELFKLFLTTRFQPRYVMECSSCDSVSIYAYFLFFRYNFMVILLCLCYFILL